MHVLIVKKFKSVISGRIHSVQYSLSVQYILHSFNRRVAVV